MNVVLRPYRLLGKVPHGPTLMFTSLLGRLHLPAIPLVVTFLIADWTGSYAVAGTVTAAMTIGQGIAGPLRGRAADRSSAPKLLVVTAVCNGLGVALIPLLVSGPIPGSVWWLILPVAFLTGLATPPVAPLGRAIWPRIASPAAINAAYAVEATMQEMLFIVAPIVVASVIALYNPVIAMVGCAVLAVAGPTLFAWALWRAGLREAPARTESDQRPGGLFRTPGFLRLLVFGGLVVGGLVGTDLLLVGWARDRETPELAGILGAVWAAGSLIGGLAMGASVKPPRLWLRALLSALGLFALVPVLPPITEPASPWLVGLVLFLGGGAVAPTLAATNGKLGDIAPRDRRTEAFGWYSTATTGGMALASPLVGALLDIGGPAMAAGVGGGLILLGVILVAHRSITGSRPTTWTEQSVST